MTEKHYMTASEFITKYVYTCIGQTDDFVND